MLLQILQYLQGNVNASTIIYGAWALLLPLTLGLAFGTGNGNAQTTRRQLKHLRNLGLPVSNMKDQYDPKFAKAEGAEIDGPVRIKALYLHPIKSCGPVEVNRALLTKSGFMYDRCFALATEVKDPEGGTKWRFISQRTKPSMSLVKTEIWLPHKESDQHDPLVQTGGCVVVTFPDPDTVVSTSSLKTIFHPRSSFENTKISFIVPLDPTSTQIKAFGLQLKSFAIHSRDAEGLDMGKIPSVSTGLAKLKKFLRLQEHEGFKLLKCTPDTLARTDKNLAPLKHIGSPAVHGYTDQQPVNINSLASIHAVSAMLPRENQPLNGLRFRANIWLTGAPAFEEETWKRYRILPKIVNTQPRARMTPHLSVVCRTSRCTIPNVDPNKGAFDADIPPPDKKRGKPQPSTTLVKNRTVETGNKAALGYIGMHCVPEDWSLAEAKGRKPGLFVEVGDEIDVLERGEHLYGSTWNEY